MLSVCHLLPLPHIINPWQSHAPPRPSPHPRASWDMSAQLNHWVQGPPPPKEAHSTANHHPQTHQAPRQKQGRGPPYRPARLTTTNTGPPGGSKTTKKSGNKLGGAAPLQYKDMCDRRASWAASLPQAPQLQSHVSPPNSNSAPQPPILPPAPGSAPHWPPRGPHIPLGPQLHAMPNVPTNNRFNLLSDQAGN